MKYTKDRFLNIKYTRDIDKIRTSKKSIADRIKNNRFIISILIMLSILIILDIVLVNNFVNLLTKF